jgi:hypothetical protein
MPDVQLDRNQDCAEPSDVRSRQVHGRYDRAADMSGDLNLIQIAVRVGMACALTAISVAGIFIAIRLIAWVG